MRNSNAKRIQDFLDNIAMIILLVISIPFYLVVTGIEKLVSLAKRNK